MKSGGTSPDSISTYIAQFPLEVQALLTQMRQVVGAVSVGQGAAVGFGQQDCDVPSEAEFEQFLSSI